MTSTGSGPTDPSAPLRRVLRERSAGGTISSATVLARQRSVVGQWVSTLDHIFLMPLLDRLLTLVKLQSFGSEPKNEGETDVRTDE